MPRSEKPQRVRRSAGVLLYRRSPEHGVQVFLAHPGGPFWARKDDGHWTIPKGEPEPGEDLLAAALREFSEETGLPTPAGPYHTLGSIVQKGGKHVYAWACEGDADPARIRSNIVKIPWPPRSGRMLQIPEIDRCDWFPLAAARTKIRETQLPLLDRLEKILSGHSAD